MKKNKIMFFAIVSIMIILNIRIVSAQEIDTVDDNKTNEIIEPLEDSEVIVSEDEPEILKVEENESEIFVPSVQKAKVITSKVDEDNNPLSGAILQILDSDGNVLDEWISDGKNHETMLADGNYILHEVQAPVGYELANDQEFTIKIEIKDIEASADHENFPCPHNGGVPLYYIDVEGKKQEVYCINQGWEEPVEYVYQLDEDGNIIYDEKGNPTFEKVVYYDENGKKVEEYVTKKVEYNGEILNPEEIRNFTEQTVQISDDVEQKMDVSDTSLSNQELYDKIVDIVYHRYKATEDFSDLSETEIRFITEYALKNYTSAGVTVRQSIRDENGNNIKYYDENGKVYYKYEYIKFLRDYRYDSSSPQGYVRDDGNGNALGNLARHWYYSHSDKFLPTKYVDLFNYLIRDDDHHPDDMYLYIYSNLSDPIAPNASERYQNLLGITGYFEIFKPTELSLTSKSNFSKEETKIKVTKEWDDGDYINNRPSKITVNLFAGGKLHASSDVTEENNWEYTFEKLPVYNKGNKIVYTIEEVNLPEYYTEISGDMNLGFTIKNTRFGIGGDEEEPQTNNPQTFDSIDVYIVMLLISAFLLKKYYKQIA